jgi:hypothetical protein
MKSYKIERRNAKGQTVATSRIAVKNLKEAEEWVSLLSNHDNSTFTITEEA